MIKYIFEGFTNLVRNLFGILSKEEKILFDKRLDICLKCKFMKDNRCSICGCFIKAKTKVNYVLDDEQKSIEGCPKRFW